MYIFSVRIYFLLLLFLLAGQICSEKCKYTLCIPGIFRAFGSELNNFTSFLMPYLLAITKINNTKKHTRAYKLAQTHTQKKFNICIYIWYFQHLMFLSFFALLSVHIFSHFILFVVIILPILLKHFTSLSISNVSKRAHTRSFTCSHAFVCVLVYVYVWTRACALVYVWQFGSHLMCGDVEHFSTFRVYTSIAPRAHTKRLNDDDVDDDDNWTQKWKAQRKIEWNKNNRQPYVFIGWLFVPPEKKNMRDVYVTFM